MKRPADGPVTKTTAQKQAAARHLKAIKLKRSQLEAVTGDVDLDVLKLALKGFASESILEDVLSADVERTIEGASTFTVKVQDTYGDLIRSPFLAAKVDTLVDGLWFRLVGVSGAVGDEIELVFEDREVAVLRTYDKPKSAAWGTTTRPKFIKAMINEVKEMPIPFICPELGSVKEIGGSIEGPAINDEQDANRTPGFTVGSKVKVKRVFADEEQKFNISRVLNVGISRKARRKVLVCAIMTITQESTCRNLTGGDRDSVGLFQQRPSQGWGTVAECLTPEHAAGKFYDQAIPYDAEHPLGTYGEVCQAVQRSAYPTAYDVWRTEAEQTVTEFGIPGGDNSTAADVGTANNFKLIATEEGMFVGTSAAGEDFQFTRGNFSKSSSGKRKVDREDTWTCTGRLAEEVQWRRFMLGGEFYYMSDHYMFKSKPRVHIAMGDEYLTDFPQFRFDIGEKNAEVTVKALANRWAAPPGSVVILEDMGVLDGRWLVTNIKRSLFSAEATITLSKPRPRLPEKKQETGTAIDLSSLGLDSGSVSTPGMASGYVAPLATDGNLSKSEFDYIDAEGAPDNFGVRHHAGKDWFAKGGTPVVAPIGGTLVEIKPSPGNSGQVFGGTVKLQQDNGMVWVFRHVDPVMAFHVGARVQQGQHIASVCTWADNPSSSHTHIEFWKTLAGGYDFENMLDPVKVLKSDMNKNKSKSKTTGSTEAPFRWNVPT